MKLCVKKYCVSSRATISALAFAKGAPNRCFEKSLSSVISLGLQCNDENERSGRN